MKKKSGVFKIALSFLFAAIFVLLPQNSAFAETKTAVVINMHGEINDALVAYLDRELQKAEESGADVVIIDIDTWGGFVFAAEEIQDILSKTKLHTIAYISKKAVSAGVMVTISCDKVVMTPGSHSGAAETIPNDEKTLSAWVGLLTAAAEAVGRPVDVVKAMADKREQIEGLTSEGELLDIIPQQAVEYGYADIIASSHEEALAAFGYTDYETVTAETSTADMAARFLTSQTVLSILFVAGVFFMVMELFTAGIRHIRHCCHPLLCAILFRRHHCRLHRMVGGGAVCRGRRLLRHRNNNPGVWDIWHIGYIADAFRADVFGPQHQGFYYKRRDNAGGMRRVHTYYV